MLENESVAKIIIADRSDGAEICKRRRDLINVRYPSTSVEFLETPAVSTSRFHFCFVCITSPYCVLSISGSRTMVL